MIFCHLHKISDRLASSPVMAVATTGSSQVVASQSATATAPKSAPATAVAPQPAPVSTSTVTAIEVTAKSGGKLFFQNKEIATLWDNETHTIPVDGPGTYALKMVFADHTETRSVVINTRGITKLSFGGTYTVGQPGPAGGIVFFDKGSYSDGWRFLEAASTDIPGTAEWGAYEKKIVGTTTGRGAGKRNTQIIADFLRDIGETGRAAQIVQDFRQGGYDDWFLPSKDELNLMYVNLKEKGLGRFGNGWYWSSSQSDTRSDYPNIYAWIQNFSNGGQAGDMDGANMYAPSSRKSTNSVRPIRQF